MNDGTLLLEVLAYGAFWLWLLALPPAALVTALKERWLYFATGWIVLGIPWLIGALTLAAPDSGWAKRFYGPEKMARAADPGRHPRPARVTAIWISGSLALLLAIGMVTARPAPIVGVGGQALQHSVGGADLGLSTRPCRHEDRGIWACAVYDASLSGAIVYRVEMRRLGCWAATRLGPPAESSPRRLSGCITIWDQLRPFDAVL